MTRPMEPSIQPRAEIDLCDFLFLREITELDDNGLRLLLQEGTVALETVSVKVGGAEISGCHRIESTSESRLFEVVWQRYVAYAVRNESFVSPDEYEISVGSRFRVYSRSSFLDFVRSATFVTDDYPGPIQHIAVTCEDDIVDVVSTKEPTVKRLRPILPQADVGSKLPN